jgi:putative membrane protein
MMQLMALAIGVVMLAFLWLGPLPSLASHSFAAHMTLHMGVVAVAAPLIAFGLASGAADPAEKWPHVFSAIPASLLELAVVWAWHTPSLHHAARTTTLGLCMEQGFFLTTGLLLWVSALGGAGKNRQRLTAGMLALLLTSAHMTLLGALLGLSSRPLFLHVASPQSTAAQLDDQHLGGVIMLVVGGIAYLAGGVWLATRLLDDRLRERPRPVPWGGI